MSERWDDITELSAAREFYVSGRFTGKQFDDLAAGKRDVIWTDDFNCKRCEGTGQVDRELMADGIAVSVESCPDCKGRGEA